MKIWKKAISVVCASILGGSAFAGYVGDDFDSSDEGPVTNVGTWKATSSSVVVTNAGKYHSSDQAVMIPTLQTVSNAPSIAATRVWTDFWTIPRPFVSTLDAAPYVESSASAQFFISNTSWAVMSGAGGSTVRTYATDWAGTNIAIVNDESTWQHVSVLHDYNTNKWVLFVNGGPVTSNCVDFMASVSGYGWFAIENGGGDSSNRTWLDDVLITNRIPASLTRDDDADQMLDAWELMYFSDLGANQLANATNANPYGGTYTLAQESYLRTDPLNPADPTAAYVDEVVFNSTNAAILSMQTNGSSGMRLNFNVGADRTYRVLHSAVHGAPYSLVGSFYTGPGGETNWWVHTNALVSARGYYMLNAIVGPLTVTNDEVYTFFWQSRQVGSGNPGSNFWVGVVIDYGPSNRLDSTLGEQLAQGLDISDTLTVYYNGQTAFELQGGGWVKDGSGPIDVDTPIPLGVGMVIRRATAGTGEIAVMSGRMITSNGISLTLPQGWNMIAWPFEGSNDINAANANLKTADNAGDFIWIYRNGAYKKLRNQPTTTSWLMSGGGTIPADVRYLRFGEGVFYSNTTAELTWSPTD